MQLLPTLRRRTTGALPSPWRDWDWFDEQMQRFMEGIAPREAAAEAFVWAPRVDFAEQNGGYRLTAEIPGIEPGDVEIEVEGNVLSIKGEKKDESEREDERVRVSERRYGAFERTFTLPSTADPNKVTADFHQGVLTVDIGKRPEARGRKIEVQAK